ncbi:RNA polymerase sigma factor FliA [Paraferrimonas sp. SM1919]|uniref:RNA polymerase sigma factor FliA n=1 Tax=Paraferrimonas sp. SM1919 TaxID=2662263 RepID=UPI0013D2733B|nr:RNA polymerase sigma factor FliA [Paraferrimonas sp. SM1919]
MNKLAAYTQFVPKESIAQQYAPLVKRIALHLMARLPASVQLDDLLQAGMLGLLEAAGRFDGSKGASFETFAGIRIRGAMLDEVRKGDWAPRSVHRNQRAIVEAATVLEQSLGREASELEIAQHLEVDLATYRHMVQDSNNTKVVGFDDVTGGEEIIEVEQPITCLFKELADEKFKEALAQAISSLPEREVLVLSLYYDEELNLKEIGAVIDVSESRVSQILSQSIKKLKGKLTQWNQN